MSLFFCTRPVTLAALRPLWMPLSVGGDQIAEVDHILPLAEAREIGNELANLEMLPAKLNRAKSDKVGDWQLALAKKLRAAGLLSDAQMAEVQLRFRPAGTDKYELPGE